MKDQVLRIDFANDENSVESSDSSSSSEESSESSGDSSSSVVSSSPSESSASQKTESDQDESSSSDSEYDETTDGESSALPDTDDSSSESEEDETEDGSDSESESESEESATEKSNASEGDESMPSKKPTKKAGKGNQAISRKAEKTVVKKKPAEASESSDEVDKNMPSKKPTKKVGKENQAISRKAVKTAVKKKPAEASKSSDEVEESKPAKNPTKTVGKGNHVVSRKAVKTTAKKKPVESSESSDSSSSASDDDESESGSESEGETGSESENESGSESENENESESESESTKGSSDNISRQAEKDGSKVEELAKGTGRKKGGDRARDETKAKRSASRKDVESEGESDESSNEDSSSAISENEMDEEPVPASPIKPLTRRSSISSALEPGSPAKTIPKPDLEDDVSIGTVDTAAVVEAMQAMMDPKSKPTEDTIPEEPEQEEGIDTSTSSEQEDENVQVDSPETSKVELVNAELQVEENEVAEKEKLEPQIDCVNDSEKTVSEDVAAPTEEKVEATPPDSEDETVLIPDSADGVSEQVPEKKKRGLFSRLTRSRSENRHRSRLPPPRTFSVDSTFSQEDTPQEGGRRKKRSFLRRARSNSRERTPPPPPPDLPPTNDTIANPAVSSAVLEEPKLVEPTNNIEIPEEFESTKVEDREKTQDVGGQQMVEEAEASRAIARDTSGVAPSVEDPMPSDDTSRPKAPRGLFSFLRRNIIGDKRAATSEASPDSDAMAEQKHSAEEEKNAVEVKATQSDADVKKAAAETPEPPVAALRMEDEQDSEPSGTETNNITCFGVVPSESKENQRLSSLTVEERGEEDEPAGTGQWEFHECEQEGDNGSELSVDEEIEESVTSSEETETAEPVSVIPEASENSVSSDSNATIEEVAETEPGLDEQTEVAAVHETEVNAVSVVTETNAPETAEAESKPKDTLLEETILNQENNAVEEAMEVSKEADIVESNEPVPEKPKKKGFNFLQMMSLRRQMADQDADSSNPKKKESPKKAPEATMSSDLQAIMERRRELAEAEGAAVQDPVVERKVSPKKSSMNAEMEAILQRRRQVEERGPQLIQEGSESGHEEASEIEEVVENETSESEDASESVESAEELEVIEEEESESEPSCGEESENEVDEEMGVMEEEHEILEEEEFVEEEDVSEEEEIFEEVVEEEIVDEVEAEDEVEGYFGQPGYDVEAPKDQPDSRLAVPIYLAQEAATEQAYSRSLNDTTLETTDDEIISYDIETGSSEASNEKDASENSGAEKEEDKKPGFSKRRVLLVALILLVIGICGGIGVGFLLAGDDSSNEALPISPTEAPTMNPTQAPTSIVDPAVKEYYDLICPRIENCNVLLDTETPQGKAFKWLVEENELLSFYSDEKIVQRYALATFYYSTNGDNWKDNTNWLSNADECLWFSTSPTRSCTASKEFVGLELDNNNVQGTIPFELSLLITLTSFSVQTAPGAAGLQGAWPGSLGNLIELRSVKLSGNSFSGTIPSQVGEWANVHTLDLSRNGFTGEVPTFLAALVKLSSLNLAGNKLTGPFPSIVLTAANGLKSLRLEGNEIVSLPASIKGLTFLQELNVAHNMLSDFPLEVTELASLTSLDMQHNKIAKAIPTQIGGLFALKELYLNGNGLVGSIPTDIGSLVSLKTSLDLSNNSLTGNIPSEIGNITKLRRLFLNSNKLSGAVPAGLASIDKISTIRLDDNDLTGILPMEVCTLYETLRPASYADCTEVISLCFNYCCTDGQGCQCRYENTDPLRCLAKG